MVSRIARTEMLYVRSFFFFFAPQKLLNNGGNNNQNNKQIIQIIYDTPATSPAQKYVAKTFFLNPKNAE